MWQVQAEASCSLSLTTGDTLVSFYKVVPGELLTFIIKRILIKVAAGEAGPFTLGPVMEILSQHSFFFLFEASY